MNIIYEQEYFTCIKTTENKDSFLVVSALGFSQAIITIFVFSFIGNIVAEMISSFIKLFITGYKSCK